MTSSDASLINIIRKVYEKNITYSDPPRGYPFLIMSPPIPGGIYMGGIDPIPFGDRDINDGSDYSICIIDVVTGDIVAFYAERSMDSDEVIENCILLQEYYPSSRFPLGAPAMMEMNRGEVAFSEYRRKKKMHLLSRKASHLGHEFKDAKGSYGWNKDKGSGREGIANDLMVKYLKLYASNIRFQRLLDELKRFPDGNNDFLDSFLGCCINWGNFVAQGEFQYKRDPLKNTRPYFTQENGIIVRKWM